MNLLDKKWLGCALMLTLTLFSCEEENTIGQEVNPSEDRISIDYEEFDLPAANILFDSVRTDNSPYLLVGSMADSIFGNISAEGYTNFNVSGNALPDSSATYDSIVLTLAYSKFFGNFPDNQTIIVREVEDLIYDGVVYTADRQANLVDGEIGRINRDVVASVDTLISIRLSQPYGQQLFSKLQAKETNSDFELGENNALALIGLGDGDALVGFNPNDINSSLVIHYHNLADTLEYNFSFSNEAGYNSIITDRSNSVLSLLTDEKLQRFDVSSERVYMNAATGIFPILDISTVFNFFDGIENINIVSAELVLPIDETDTAEFRQFAGDTRYFFANTNGQFDGTGAVTNPLSSIIMTDQSYLSGSSEAARGLPLEDPFVYETDITLFTQLYIKNEIADLDPSTPESLVVIPSATYSVNQTTILKNGVKLKVHYTVPN